jgi:protein BCP1
MVKIIGTEIQALFVLENFDGEVDYWPLKNLLSTFLEGSDAGSGFHPGELADLILEQNGATDAGTPPGANGSVIAIEGQEDVFGFFTVIDINKYRNRNCIQAVVRYILSKAPLAERTKWSGILSDASLRVGLVVSERLANVPDPLGPPLVLQTMKELSSSGVKFDYFLFITTIFREGVDDTIAAGGDVDVPAPKKQKMSPAASVQPVQYYKPEDEYFHKASTMKISFKLMRNSQANRWTLQSFAQLSKLIMLVANDRIPGILQQLHDLDN